MGTFSFAGRWGPEAIIDRFGNAQASASVKVYESDGVTLSTLYTDRTKGTTNSNPFAPDARANATFFANPGPHVLKVTVGSSVTTLNIDVPIDPDEATTDSEATAAIAAHAALATGVHGVGASTVESASGAQAKVDVAQAAAIAAAAIDATTKANAAAAASQPLDSDLTAIALLSTTTYGRALLALADAAAGRTALGLGTAALSAATDFQPVDSDLTAIAALTTTTYGRAFLALADAAAGRTALGLGTAATAASTAFDAAGAAAAAQAASQPVDSDLTAIAALSTTSFGRSFLDRADAAAGRTLLGLGTAATTDSSTYASLGGTNVQPKAQLLKSVASRAGTSPGVGSLTLGARAVTVVNDGVTDNAYPSIQVTSTGRIVMVYRQAPGEQPTSGAGNLRTSYSDDLGFTWSTPHVIFTDGGGLDVRDPYLRIMSDGTWVVSFFKSRTSDSRAQGVFVMKSSDLGATWSTPVNVGFAWTYYTACSGPVVELTGGTWLMPGYGQSSAGSIADSHCMRSADQGVTWTNEVTILTHTTTGNDTNETVVGYLADGTTLMALIRCENGNTYRATSTDGGLTWSPATVAYVGSGRPAWRLLGSGAIVVVYRHFGGVDGNRPCCYRVSWDLGVTWSAEVIIETSGFGMAYSDPAEVVPGVVAVPYGLLANRPSVSGSPSIGKIQFRYLIDGEGVDPFGDGVWPRTVVSVVGDYTMRPGDDVVLCDASSRQVTDAKTISGKQTLTSATIAATTADVGRNLTGTNIPAGTKILATPATTIAAGSNAVALPTGTINVASTNGMATSGCMLVTTDAGVQVVTYTAITEASFTGCTGGTGTMSTGGAVSQVVMSANATGSGTGLTETIGGALTVTLAPPTSGSRATVKKTDSTTNSVTIAPASGTIDGAASIIMSAQYEARTCLSDGTNVAVDGERKVYGTSPVAVGAANAAGTSNKVAREDHVHDLQTPGDARYAPISVTGTVPQFDIIGWSKSVSNTNFATFTASTSQYLAGRRDSSSAQNDEVVFLLPNVLTAGTWTLALAHLAANSAGIYTVSVSPNNSAWTDITTIDGYLASTTSVRTEATGLTIAAGMQYVRLKMATKNASSSNYKGLLASLHGLRTGA